MHLLYGSASTGRAATLHDACAGSGQDSKQNVPNGSSEPTSGQEVGRVHGTSGNLTGEDSSLLLKAASLQGTADGAELTAPLETRKHLENPMTAASHPWPEAKRGCGFRVCDVNFCVAQARSDISCKSHDKECVSHTVGPEGPLCTAGLPSQDGSGFRAYVQPANNKRKASEVGNLAGAPAAKQANHPMARAGALAATMKVSFSDSLW